MPTKQPETRLLLPEIDLALSVEKVGARDRSGETLERDSQRSKKTIPLTAQNRLFGGSPREKPENISHGPRKHVEAYRPYGPPSPCRLCPRRAAAFGLLAGVSVAGFVSGTLTAAAAATAIYLRAFVLDSNANSFVDEACDPLLQGSSCSATTSSSSSSDEDLTPRLPPHKGGLPSLPDMVALLTGSTTLSGTAIVTFFYSLGEHGLHAALLYYLKAQFGYSKDEFANLMLIVGAAGMLSQLSVIPVLARLVSEETLLILGLLGGCTHVFLYGIAWSYWVPYFATMFVILSAFVHPSIRTNVSKSVGSNEQVHWPFEGKKAKGSDGKRPN
ncbi:hypothetical protein ABZP36_020445 [Zizania latifolia]